MIQDALSPERLDAFRKMFDAAEPEELSEERAKKLDDRLRDSLRRMPAGELAKLERMFWSMTGHGAL